MVLRYLLYAFGHKPRSTVACEILPADRRARYGRLLTDHGIQHKLPGQDRIKKWARFVMSLPTDPTTTPQIDIPQELLPYPLDCTTGQTRPSKGWSATVQTDTRASFGHIIHPQESKEAPIGAAVKLDPSPAAPRSFVPLLPPLSSMDFQTNLHESSYRSSIWVLRFIPAIHQDPGLISKAPTLELLLEADPSEIKQIQSLRAITDTHIGDVLQPAGPVDVRLHQARYFSLSGVSIADHAQTVMDFLAASKLEVADGKIATPPMLPAVPIPRRLMGSHAANARSTRQPSSAEEAFRAALLEDAEQAGTGDDASPTEDSVLVDYLFAGIEVQRIITAEYAGFRAAYRHVEAGQRGGRQSEFALLGKLADPSKPQQGSADADREDPRRKFLDAVAAIASGSKGFKWQAARQLDINTLL